ncbi:MAG: phosphoglucosamine mutase [Flavobacteriales bacterium]|nr:phosphoglucosamine mutase [Flavobacteriales bacterium]
MTLIKSISGIRGTIGGKQGDNLTPIDVVKFASAFAELIRKKNLAQKIKIVVGRDARISGEMVSSLVISTLNGMGADVVDLGLTTTPTVEIAVPEENAHAGIIITASHNPKQWNALKLLNEKGEFISAEEGAEVLRIAESSDLEFAEVDALGKTRMATYLKRHIEKILDLQLVNRQAISAAGFSVAVDGVNSSGGFYVPELLRALGVQTIHELYCTPDGNFPHNPEPLPENLTEISKLVKEKKCNLGIVVDPDVDRLALICEDGSMFGEEYTLVAVSDYVLTHTPGNTVSNLSSTRALRDITEARGLRYEATAVGEVHVVAGMKEINALMGGEGNGGIIYPELHYGRDALVGIALFLSHLAQSKMKMTAMRDSYPRYVISKNKIELQEGMDVDKILFEVQHLFPEARVNTTDGVKLDFEHEWVHLRKSNTEPIIRIYAESSSKENADALAKKVMKAINETADHKR